MENRQLDNLKDAMLASLVWAGIVQDTERLNLTQSDSALAKAKSAEAADTVKTRIMEAWCYLNYPYQESAQGDVEWISAKVPVQDGLLALASKKHVSDDSILPELGPARLDRELQKYIWNGKDHLLLKDLWEYLNRYTYLPRLTNREVLAKSVLAAIGGILPGPFAYAELFDEASGNYQGLAISGSATTPVVIDSQSVIIKPDIAEVHCQEETTGSGAGYEATGTGEQGGVEEGRPTGEGGKMRGYQPVLSGTAMIASDLPARDMRQIVEGIIEQFTTIPGASVELKLEIDAEIPSGINKGKSRTLLENASTLGFIDKELG